MRVTRSILRARRDDEKDQRRRALLDSARSLFASGPYGSVKIADIAAQAGVSKATVFVYYATKESLFLALTSELIAECLGALEDALDSFPRPSSAAQVARLVAQSTMDRPELMRALTVLGGVLERVDDVATLAEFKLGLVLGLGTTGAVIERHLPLLPSGSGMRLLFRTYALVVGFRALTEPTPALQAAISRDPRLAVLQVDLGSELEAALLDMLRGFESS